MNSSQTFNNSQMLVKFNESFTGSIKSQILEIFIDGDDEVEIVDQLPPISMREHLVLELD